MLWERIASWIWSLIRWRDLGVTQWWRHLDRCLGYISTGGVMIWGVVSIRSQMIPLQDQLILSSKGGLFVLMQSLKREISCRNASIVILTVMNSNCWLIGSIDIVGTSRTVEHHLLHEVSRREFERVSLLVCDCHGHKLVLLDFDVQYLLFGDSAGSWLSDWVLNGRRETRVVILRDWLRW